MRVQDLFIYPLKSARGIHLPEAQVERAGLHGDRLSLLVTPDGKFITQREEPKLATLEVEFSETELALSADGVGLVQVPLEARADRMDVTIWRSEVNAAVSKDNVNEILSDWLGRDVRLVLFDEKAKRSANDEWTTSEAPVRFADGYPVLITTTASLAALNEDMTVHGEPPVEMDRFRANVVIEQDIPWAEDHWATISVGDVQFDLVKPCTRCIMTTQDQKTGSREGASPMPAMQRNRLSGDRRVSGVLFGWNAVPRNTGTVRCGDAVVVLEERSQGWPLKTLN